MKTNVAKKIANKVDRVIPDIEATEAKDNATRMCKNAAGAAMCWAGTYIYMGFVIIDAAELTVRGAKTLTKKAGIKVKEFYDDRTPMMEEIYK